MDSDMIVRGIGMAAALVAATMLTRFLPFVLFPPGKKTPPFMEYLGRTLPYATMGLLVVYCLKDISLASDFHGLPELISIMAMVILHWRKGNSLLSIGVGTVLYMVLAQRVFV